MSFFTTKLNSIKTEDVITFVNRWTAVISIIVTFVILSLGIWSLLFKNPPVAKIIPHRNRIIRSNANKDTLNGFYYFDGIGIIDNNTNFSIPGTTGGYRDSYVAEKCKLFGDNCLGFDTLGSLFLKRDEDIATLKGFDKSYNGGLYIKTSTDHAREICEKLGGSFDSESKRCTEFNRTEIDEYPFPTN